MSRSGIVTRRIRAVVVAVAGCLALACPGPDGAARGDVSGEPREGAAVRVTATGAGAASNAGGAGSGDPAPVPGDGDPEAATPSAEPPSGDDGSGQPARLATLWVGIYCSAPDDEPRHFSVYVDGALAQELDARCPEQVQPGAAAPNGGQFRVVVPTGVRVLRFQDDTSDYHSEHEVAVPGDHWVFVHHRVLPGETGHLTSIIDRYDRPRYAY